jgi:LysM repeat protein
MTTVKGSRRRAAKDERAMSTNDLLAKPRPALRTGSESLRRWAAENELRAVAAGAYVTAVLVMLVLVVSPVVGGPGEGAAESPTPAAAAVDVPDYYTLRQDDTLAGIAGRFGLTVEELRALNPGIDPMALAPGSKLRLSESAAPVAKSEVQAAPESRPAKKPAQPAATPPPPAPAAAAQPAPPQPQSGGTHTVAPGDTLTSIAARYGTTVADLLALNPGIDPYAIVAGQEVAVP